MTANGWPITAHALTKSFSTGPVVTPVLTGLSLSVTPGELTVVVGPSGCGKSTLLALLSGLSQPDGGRVTVNGTDLATLSAAALDRFRLDRVGFVFQGFNLFPALTALEQVLLPLGYLRLPPAQARARAAEALARVGLEARAHLRPSALSGGEKQRVAIARALAKAPRLLFADEPTSALDKRNGQTVGDLLRRCAHDDGATVVCVSHDPRLIGFADRVLTMEDGRIQSDERPASPHPFPLPAHGDVACAPL
ncbi:ABC transporter ATP-binding protein [Azospirillum griseum]|uniref:ABC transporter ATP-binding protein n=1 Tax=Azospirillum griseum TaxID=2496639 RepID=A0A431VLU8_9PROT|nr:ABC transporter ATP-binding protein [Azospirillum griseum]RTR22991.1 ABC transporter ATP-binding protein [Azospirillum griseum]